MDFGFGEKTVKFYLKSPMSLDVAEMVKKGQIRSAECIQCGACVDSCPRKVLSYSMKPVETKKKIRELENQK